jgi:hypothetical protein
MARILKRPMFNRGGSSNQGIMDGLVDRTGLAEGTPKFDTGKMKEDAGNILSKISKFTPGGMIGKAAQGIASMAKGNEAEIIKAVQKMLAVTPIGQIPAAIKFLADRYRIDPTVVERIAKNQMADANAPPEGPASADEGFPSRPDFESSAEDTSVMPRKNRFDEEAFIPDRRFDRFKEERFVPDQSFPELGPDKKGGGDGGELMPLPYPYERDYGERLPLPYPYERDLGMYMDAGPNTDPGMFMDRGYNQGGRVGLSNGTSPFDDKRTAADVEAITGAMNKFAPVPETRLPIGQLGASLMSGRGFKDSAVDAYGSFVTADDKRRAAMAGRTGSAVSTSLGQQIAERNAKLKAMGSSNMQKDFSDDRKYFELYKEYTKEAKNQYSKNIRQLYPASMAEFASKIQGNANQTKAGQEFISQVLGVVPNNIKSGQAQFDYGKMNPGGLYFHPGLKVFVERVPASDDQPGELVTYNPYTFKEVSRKPFN